MKGNFTDLSLHAHIVRSQRLSFLSRCMFAIIVKSALRLAFLLKFAAQAVESFRIFLYLRFTSLLDVPKQRQTALFASFTIKSFHEARLQGFAKRSCCEQLLLTFQGILVLSLLCSGLPAKTLLEIIVLWQKLFLSAFLGRTFRAADLNLFKEQRHSVVNNKTSVELLHENESINQRNIELKWCQVDCRRLKKIEYRS